MVSRLFIHLDFPINFMVQYNPTNKAEQHMSNFSEELRHWRRVEQQRQLAPDEEARVKYLEEELSWEEVETPDGCAWCD